MIVEAKKVPQFWLSADTDFALEALEFMYKKRYPESMKSSAEATSLLRSIKDFREFRSGNTRKQ